MNNIRLLVLDVDGVLTDGTLLYGEQGEVIKPFNVKDGVGIKLLRNHQIEVAVITAKNSAPLHRRMADLDVQHFYPGCKDKLSALSELMSQLGLEKSQVAYVGDDVIDLPAIRAVGYSFAPADAYAMILNEVDHVCRTPGGRGVAREVADLILASQFDLNEIYRTAWDPSFEKGY